MTQQTSDFTSFHTSTLVRPSLIQLSDSKWIIFGDRDGTEVSLVDIKTSPITIKEVAGFPRHVILDSTGIPNAVLYDNRYIYSFGDQKNPYIIKYDCVECKFTELNEKDKLNRRNTNIYKISNRAKTQLLGDNNIIICSKECEVVLYDIKENKFVNAQRELFEEGEKSDMDVFVTIKPFKDHRQTYYFLSRVAQGYMTVDIEYGLRIATHAYSRTFVPYYLRPVMTLIPTTNIMICIGGLKGIKGSDEIHLLNIKTRKSTKSSIKLPVGLCDHNIIYIKSTNCLYIIGGCANDKLGNNNTSYSVNLDVFKKDIEKIKS